MIHALIIPFVIMLYWFGRYRMMGPATIQFTQWLRNFLKIPIMLINVYNIFLDVVAIIISRRYLRMAKLENNN